MDADTEGHVPEAPLRFVARGAREPRVTIVESYVPAHEAEEPERRPSTAEEFGLDAADVTEVEDDLSSTDDDESADSFSVAAAEDAFGALSSRRSRLVMGSAGSSASDVSSRAPSRSCSMRRTLIGSLAQLDVAAAAAAVLESPAPGPAPAPAAAPTSPLSTIPSSAAMLSPVPSTASMWGDEAPAPAPHPVAAAPAPAPRELTADEEEERDSLRCLALFNPQLVAAASVQLKNNVLAREGKEIAAMARMAVGSRPVHGPTETILARRDAAVKRRAVNALTASDRALRARAGSQGRPAVEPGLLSPSLRKRQADLRRRGEASAEQRRRKAERRGSSARRPLHTMPQMQFGSPTLTPPPSRGSTRGGSRRAPMTARLAEEAANATGPARAERELRSGVWAGELEESGRPSTSPASSFWGSPMATAPAPAAPPAPAPDRDEPARLRRSPLQAAARRASLDASSAKYREQHWHQSPYNIVPMQGEACSACGSGNLRAVLLCMFCGGGGARRRLAGRALEDRGGGGGGGDSDSSDDFEPRRPRNNKANYRLLSIQQKRYHREFLHRVLLAWRVAVLLEQRRSRPARRGGGTLVDAYTYVDPALLAGGAPAAGCQTDIRLREMDEIEDLLDRVRLSDSSSSSDSDSEPAPAPAPAHARGLARGLSRSHLHSQSMLQRDRRTSWSHVGKQLARTASAMEAQQLKRVNSSLRRSASTRRMRRTGSTLRHTRERREQVDSTISGTWSQARASGTMGSSVPAVELARRSNKREARKTFVAPAGPTSTKLAGRRESTTILATPETAPRGRRQSTLEPVSESAVALASEEAGAEAEVEAEVQAEAEADADETTTKPKKKKKKRRRRKPVQSETESESESDADPSPDGDQVFLSLSAFAHSVPRPRRRTLEPPAEWRALIKARAARKARVVPLRTLYDLVLGLYEEKLKQDRDLLHEPEYAPTESLAAFVLQAFQRRFGEKRLVSQRLAQLYASLRRHAGRDAWVLQFARLLGMAQPALPVPGALGFLLAALERLELAAVPLSRTPRGMPHGKLLPLYVDKATPATMHVVSALRLADGESVPEELACMADEHSGQMGGGRAATTVHYVDLADALLYCADLWERDHLHRRGVLRQLFAAHDVRRRGAMSFDEFCAVFRSPALAAAAPGPEALKAAFASAAARGDSLDEDAFVAAAMRCTGTAAGRVRQAIAQQTLVTASVVVKRFLARAMRGWRRRRRSLSTRAGVDAALSSV